MKKLLILGGGTAGTMVANQLHRPLAKRGWSITVVDRDDEHHYQPGYLFLPFGIYDRSKIVKPRHSYIPEGVDLVLGEIDSIDPAAKSVALTDGRQLDYDYLIIATGTAPRPDQVTGMAEAMGNGVHEFYSLPGAERLTTAMKAFQGGRLLVQICEMPIKCPVAPLEFTLLAEDYLTKRGLRERTEIVYVTPLDGAFTKPIATREIGNLLDSRGIKLEADFMIEHVDGAAKKIVSYDGRELAYDLLVTVPVNMAPDYVGRSGLGDDLNYVPVDKHTLRSDKYPEIFALGDGSAIPTSKAGAVAHFAAENLSKNLVELIDGLPMTHSFDGHANCFIESGRGRGMLLDFNYDTEPLTGKFPLPIVGPFSLLKESRANHLGKVAFRGIYWGMLMRGRPLPLPVDMIRLGKRFETDETPTAATPAYETAAPGQPSLDEPPAASVVPPPQPPRDDPAAPTVPQF